MAGAIEPLVDLLKDEVHQHHRELLRAAEAGAEPGKRSNADGGTPNATIAALIKPHAQLKAAGAIAGIAAGGPDNQNMVKEAGGIELLVGLLRRLDVQEEATPDHRDLHEKVPLSAIECRRVPRHLN